MSKKKSFGIILLLLFLIWGVFNVISRIFFRTDSVDILVWENFNLVWVLYLLSAVILVLNLVSIVAIFKPGRWGMKSLYVLFILNVILTLTTSSISAIDLQAFKEMIIESRTSRGLDIEGVDFISSPAFIAITSAIYTLFYILLTLYVYKRRDYFSDD